MICFSICCRRKTLLFPEISEEKVDSTLKYCWQLRNLMDGFKPGKPKAYNLTMAKNQFSSALLPTKASKRVLISSAYFQGISSLGFV